MRDLDFTDKQLPYDPSDVDIRKQTFSVGHIIDLIADGRIELWREEDYQRKGNSWDIKQRSRLIESIIMRIPLPIFYFDGSEYPWKIIDGLHRLTGLFTYIQENKWALNEVQYLRNFEGCYFDDLPFKYRRVVLESTIEAYVINPGTPNRVKLNIFQRINTGGSSLSRQEIRNAYYRGTPVDFIDFLSSSQDFLQATNGKISRNRMKDKEAVLRFIAFYKFIDVYEQPLERFLDFAMEKIYDLSKENLMELEKKFLNSMRLCHIIFEGLAFYILNINGEKQSNNVNIALFETWSVNLAKLDDEQTYMIIQHRDKLFNRFVHLIQDVEFHKSISSSTSSKKAINTRFLAIDRIIKNVLNVN